MISRRAVGVFLTLVWLAGAALRPVAAEGPAPTARIVFVGDIMIGRNVGTWIADRGTAYTFGAVAPFLAAADITFGNMESPLTTTPRVVGGYDLRAEPEYGEALRLAGFDVVSLANNHATDNGRNGLRETMVTLNNLGIEFVGAGETVEAARSPLVKEVNGVRIAFLGYDGTGATLQATETEAGCLWLTPHLAVKDVQAAREVADIVVVSAHWGAEYEPLPNSTQRSVAKQLADAGADIIIGHHPHVVEPVEWITGEGRTRPTLVAYSLGNFSFDQWFSDETMQSAILSCEVSRQGTIGFGLQPVKMHEGRTLPADRAYGEAVLSRLLLPPTEAPWELAVSPDADVAPTVWWLEPTAAQAADGGLFDLDGDGVAGRVGCAAGGWQALASGGSYLASPPAWQVHDWSMLPAGMVGKRLALTLSEPPRWAGVQGGIRDEIWQCGPGNGGGERLYVLECSDSGWSLVSRSAPLSHKLVALACPEGTGGGPTRCVAIEERSEGERRVAGWLWHAGRWQRTWAGPAGTSASLLLWDTDGDGQREVLVRSNH